MADFEAPSFSLGLDFDLFDSEPHVPAASEANEDPSASNRTSEAATIDEDDDNDFETLTVVESDTEDEGSPPKLKRLRRGPTVDAGVSSASVKSKADLDSAVVVDDDDIEEFSSPEDNHTDERLSTQHRSVCTSSKFPLSGHGVLTKQSGKRKQIVSDAPESVITSCNNQVFPKLTISPLRKFQLIDSDSDTDDPYISEAANNKTYNGSESSLNKRQPNLVQRVRLSEREKLKESINTSTRKDLWEDFQPAKSFHIPTPALDEVCEEYFSSMKDKSKSQSNTGNSDQSSHVTSSMIDLDSLPPARRYFFHNDPRVQGLVRSRLPNFFPLDAANRDSEQLSTSNIDYMGQFSHGESSKPAARTKKGETSSRNNPRKSNPREMSKGSVNSKSDTDKGIPKVAGKRRVQADGQASGHWFVGPDRKKVYVSKSGQELTGRAAYVLYKKESGAGFKKTKAKKKASTKKK